MKLSEFPVFDESPFRYEGIVTTERVVRKGREREISMVDTGEIGVATFSTARSVRVDTLEFRKVFVNSLDQVREFSIPAFKVWCCILANIGIGKERLYLPNRTVMEYCGYTTMNTAYLGLFELLEAEFIKRATGESCYWINPNKMFNGHRDDKEVRLVVPDYIQNKGWGVAP